MSRNLFLSLIIISLIGLSFAQLPSDLIAKKNSSPIVLDLRNVLPESAKMIDGLNPELTAFKDKGFPNLGRYSSYNKNIVQEDYVGLGNASEDFLGKKDNLTESVGNPSGNITKIDGNMTGLEGLMYL